MRRNFAAAQLEPRRSSAIVTTTITSATTKPQTIGTPGDFHLPCGVVELVVLGGRMLNSESQKGRTLKGMVRWLTGLRSRP